MPAVLINMSHPFALARQIAQEYVNQIAGLRHVMVNDYGVPQELVEQVVVNAQADVGDVIEKEAILAAADIIRAKLTAMNEVEDGVKKQ